MKKLALLQSNYIPWIGYFNLIQNVDEFYFYDEVQKIKNRNEIITPQGKMWLTIPVRHEYLGQPINEVQVANSKWSRIHWEAIKSCFRKAENYKELKNVLEKECRPSCYTSTVLGLPLHLDLTNVQVEFAAEFIIEFYNK